MAVGVAAFDDDTIAQCVPKEWDDVMAVVIYL